MLFTFIFPRDRVARAEPVRADAALVARDDLSHRVRNEREIDREFGGYEATGLSRVKLGDVKVCRLFEARLKRMREKGGIFL